VALEVVDSAWWKQQLRVKSAGSRRRWCTSVGFGLIFTIFSETYGQALSK
jgi:hypothetical protein